MTVQTKNPPATTTEGPLRGCKSCKTPHHERQQRTTLPPTTRSGRAAESPRGLIKRARGSNTVNTEYLVPTESATDVSRRRTAEMDRLQSLDPEMSRVEAYRQMMLQEERTDAVACASLRVTPTTLERATQIVTSAMSDEKAPAPDLVSLMNSGALTDWLNEPDQPIEWLLPGLLTVGGTSLYGGAPKIGKSATGLQQSFCLAFGRPFMGRTPRRRFRVLHIEAEGSRVSIKQRARRMGEKLNITAQSLRGPDHDAQLHFQVVKGLNLRVQSHLIALVAAILDHQAEYLFIGPLSAVAPGLNENDAQEITAFLTPFTGIAAETGCHITLMHHNRKPAGDGRATNADDAINQIRGSGAFRAGVDTIYGLVRNPAKDQGHLFAEGRDLEHQIWEGFEWRFPVIEPAEVSESLFAPKEEKILEYLLDHGWSSAIEIAAYARQTRQATVGWLKKLIARNYVEADTTARTHSFNVSEAYRAQMRPETLDSMPAEVIELHERAVAQKSKAPINE